ncbi:MAG: DUF4249 domain-containing protein [Cyclobacteriaceae bacterium]|nr:DUF4249 domain-containing protein [Cyclobacteriaceae bacterium]
MRKLFPVFLAFLAACIDPLSVNVNRQSAKRLVVDGYILNGTGLNSVKLFYSNPLTISRPIAFEIVTGALVEIVDDQNNRYDLFEVQPGVYSSSALTGILGRSYKVVIETPDGQNYESEPETIEEAGVIDDVSFEVKSPPVNGNGALSIYINARGVSGSDNLFRWRWTTIHKVKSHPELHVTPTPGGDRPTPEPCSGYVYRPAMGGLVQVGDCTCCICWSYNYNDKAFVSRNELVKDNLFSRQFLGEIPVTAMHFYEKYYLEIQQLSLSQDSYNYWDLVQKQQQGSTNLFQPNSIKIRGNVRNVNDPNAEVLGIFSASGAVSKSVYVNISDWPYPLTEPDTIPFSCLDYFKNPTTNKPLFW